MQECVLCRIARREMQAHVVYEDEKLLAFLDIGPIRPGHSQIIPKQHFPYFDQAPPDVIAAIVLVGQRLATAMKRFYGVERVAFMFTGGDIAHVHAHVVPMHEKTDITSRQYIVEDEITFRARPRAADAELAAVASSLRQALLDLA
jgi:histidine triad (HIT) family protein